MKILLVNHFPLEGSGSGTYTKNLAMQLAARGHRVCVVMPENRTDYARYEGVELHPVMFTPESTLASSPEEQLISEDALPFNFPCFTTHPNSTMTFGRLSDDQLKAYMQAFRQALAQELERFQPDLIHAQHVWVLSALAAECGVPLVVTAHGTDLMGLEKWLHLRNYAEMAMDVAKKIICISKDNEALVLKTFPAHTHKVLRMSNGYNPAIFFPQKLNPAEVLTPYGIPYKGEQIVLLAGKLTQFKGVDVLLEAAQIYEAALDADGVVPLTLVAGDGQLRQELEAQAQQLGLKKLHFLGNVAQEKLCELYNIASVDVVPSRREPFGLVAVEAMACGTPVVATNEGGLPDFVNESVGALVPVGDATALASAITAALARVALEPSWRTFIAGYAESSYSQAAIIGELEDVYRSVL